MSSGMDSGMDSGASYTGLRLLAVIAVMAGSVSLSIGASAIDRHLQARADAADAPQVLASAEAIVSESVAAVEAALPPAPAPLLDGGDAGVGASDDEKFVDFASLAAASEGALRPDHTLAPSFGSVALNGEPLSTRLQAGGEIAASALGETCGGYVSDAPSVRLTRETGHGPLMIDVAASAATTLVVRAPNGAWRCSADGHPLLSFGPDVTGQFDIWVGSSNANARPEAQLRIMER